MIQDLRLSGCGFLERPLLPMNQERLFHLFYVFDGSGLLTVDSSSWPCGRDSLFFFPSLEVALPQPVSRSRLTILHLSFTCTSHHMVRELVKLPHNLPSPAWARDLFLAILQECSLKPAFYTDLCSLYLEQLLVPAMVSRSRDSGTCSPAFPTRGLTGSSLPASSPNVLSSPSLNAVCAHVDRHLGEDLSLPVLCDIARQNPRQLGRLFRREFHQSAVEYISSRRISRAKELLYFSSCSVTEIAEQCGFKSVHYFSRVFKKKTGRSPADYRRNCLGAIISRH